MDINMILAVGKDGSIGRDGELIWKIPNDLKRFKELTTGHPVVMGRKTWESLPKKPLPGRRNIVISRNPSFNPEGAEKVSSIEEAMILTAEDSPFIIGGAQIYNSFLPFITRLYLTEIDGTDPEADAFFYFQPDSLWEKIEETDPEISPGGVSYRYVTYRRKEQK